MKIFENQPEEFRMRISWYWMLAIGLCFSCRHEADLESIPKVSFSGRVLPIVQSNCGKSSCHDGSSEFSLRDYDQIKRKVTPFKPHKSELYKTMTYLDDFRVMPPPPAPPLEEAQLQLIYSWILQGAQNN